MKLRFEKYEKFHVEVCDDETQETIGVIQQSGVDEFFFFNPYGGIFTTEQMKQISAEMEQLEGKINLDSPRQNCGNCYFWNKTTCPHRFDDYNPEDYCKGHRWPDGSK